MAHDPEKLDLIIKMAKRCASPHPWLTDVGILNLIVDAARLVIIQPDKFHLDELSKLIKEADTGIWEAK